MLFYLKISTQACIHKRSLGYSRAKEHLGINTVKAINALVK